MVLHGHLPRTVLMFDNDDVFEIIISGVWQPEQVLMVLLLDLLRGLQNNVYKSSETICSQGVRYFYFF